MAAVTPSPNALNVQVFLCECGVCFLPHDSEECCCLTCLCGRQLCGACGANISAARYAHFCECSNPNCAHCHLYT